MDKQIIQKNLKLKISSDHINLKAPGIQTTSSNHHMLKVQNERHQIHLISEEQRPNKMIIIKLRKK